MRADHLARRRLIFSFLAPLFALAVAGCDEAIEPGDRDPSLERLEEFFPTIHSGLTEAENLVIRDQEAWSRFWDRHQPFNQRVAPPPVDFREKIVLVVALGTRTSGGYAVEIEKVESSAAEGTLEVEALETAPGEDCAVILILTQPVDAVLVSRSGADVRFRVDREVRSCG